MDVKIEIPDHLPEGRRSSFIKGIVDSLIKSATKRSPLAHTPKNHAKYRYQGKDVGCELVRKIYGVYKK